MVCCGLLWFVVVCCGVLLFVVAWCKLCFFCFPVVIAAAVLLVPSIHSFLSVCSLHQANAPFRTCFSTFFRTCGCWIVFLSDFCDHNPF